MNLGALMGKRISLIASTLRSRSNEFKTSLIERFKKIVMPHFETGEFKVYIDKVIKIDWTDATQVQEAHRFMESDQNSGKIIFAFD